MKPTDAEIQNVVDRLRSLPPDGKTIHSKNNILSILQGYLEASEERRKKFAFSISEYLKKADKLFQVRTAFASLKLGETLLIPA